MRNKVVVTCAFIVCAFVFSTREASAQTTVSASAAAFHAVYPGDATYIFNTGHQVWNTDTSTFHSVVAYLSRDYGQGTDYVATVIANNNGGTLACQIEGLDINTGTAFYSTLTTTTVRGFVSFQIPWNLGTTGYGLSLFSFYCQLPPQNVNGTSYLYGVSSFTD
jgi:hypothetical protein